MTENPVGQKRSKWMRVLLVVSLSLNLLVLGIFVGARLTGDDHREYRGASNLPIGALGRALEPEDRKALGQTFRKEMRADREVRSETRAALVQFLEVVRAEDFSADKLVKLIEQHQSRNRTAFEVGGRLLVERIAEMTPEMRAAYADRLEEAMKQNKRKRKP